MFTKKNQQICIKSHRLNYLICQFCNIYTYKNITSQIHIILSIKIKYICTCSYVWIQQCLPASSTSTRKHYAPQSRYETCTLNRATINTWPFRHVNDLLPYCALQPHLLVFTWLPFTNLLCLRNPCLKLSHSESSVQLLSQLQLNLSLALTSLLLYPAWFYGHTKTLGAQVTTYAQVWLTVGVLTTHFFTIACL